MRFVLHHSQYHYANNKKLMDYLREKHPNAQFVEELAIPTHGGYSPNPAVVLYEDTPREGYTNYFAYYRYPEEVASFYGIKPTELWRVVGLPDWSPEVDAVVTDDGEGTHYLTVSRFGHDIVCAPFSNATIDGGRNYTKVSGSPLPLTCRVNLKDMTVVFDGSLYTVERKSDAA